LRILKFLEMSSKLPQISRDVQDGEDEDLLRSFVAVVEKQGACEFHIKPAADGAPYLYAVPMVDSSAMVHHHPATSKCHSPTSYICRVFVTD